MKQSQECQNRTKIPFPKRLRDMRCFTSALGCYEVTQTMAGSTLSLMLNSAIDPRLQLVIKYCLRARVAASLGNDMLITSYFIDYNCDRDETSFASNFNLKRSMVENGQHYLR